MSPEIIYKNRWALFLGESVSSDGITIQGPTTVTVEEQPSRGELTITCRDKKVTVSGTNFENVVEQS